MMLKIDTLQIINHSVACHTDLSESPNLRIESITKGSILNIVKSIHDKDDGTESNSSSTTPDGGNGNFQNMDMSLTPLPNIDPGYHVERAFFVPKER